jgi:hypothetical protein
MFTTGTMTGISNSWRARCRSRRMFLLCMRAERTSARLYTRSCISGILGSYVCLIHGETRFSVMIQKTRRVCCSFCADTRLPKKNCTRLRSTSSGEPFDDQMMWGFQSFRRPGITEHRNLLEDRQSSKRTITINRNPKPNLYGTMERIHSLT